ncbi:putative Phosphoglycolate phosphatase [Nitrospira japonica]|uniref:phosphoglycolate phosphatase n=1 Tax=Nitrospira japonica TaxID=1325564 RepID=A0A1W1I233_9BACT|nr:HAD-IA family hydrolase [Nitrospira japonica]SLM47076.1 putative Phosphoglycolate phosphatase [Nitrospira japonica]
MGKTPVDLLIFDLDGTLIESKWDIAASVNLTLAELGLPQRPLEEIFGFVGDGVKKLLRQAVGDDNPDRFDEALRVFRGHYLAHCLDRTRFYPGIERMLQHFGRTSKAVATNKSIEFTNVILQGLGAQHFQFVVGGDNGFGLKPEPGMLRHIMERLNASPERTVLVGDSTNDINGGHNAGIRVCAVGYGMGNRERMTACRPDWFIERPEELMEIFE